MESTFNVLPVFAPITPDKQAFTEACHEQSKYQPNPLKRLIFIEILKCTNVLDVSKFDVTASLTPTMQLSSLVDYFEQDISTATGRFFIRQAQK